MVAPVGNSFWKLANNPPGAPKEFKTKEELWEKACEYFQWVEENPLKEEKLFHFQGEVVKGTQDKMRAMTLGGLCLYLNIDRQTFDNYSNDEKYQEYFGICTRIREIIYDQKFTGASADLLNANIIARDLGLADKKDVTTKGESIKSFNDFYSEE